MCRAISVTQGIIISHQISKSVHSQSVAKRLVVRVVSINVLHIGLPDYEALQLLFVGTGTVNMTW